MHEINQSVKTNKQTKKHRTLRSLPLSCVVGFQVPGKDGLSGQALVLVPSTLALGLKLAPGKGRGSCRDSG